MTYGYILVLVTILANGDVTGHAVDYYDDPHECYAMVQYEEDIADPGVGFVCIEDIVDK